MSSGLLLVFGKETIEVEAVNILRQEITLRRCSLEGEARIPLNWKTLRDGREQYARYGVTPFGRMDEIVCTWPRAAVQDRLTLFARDFYPDFNGWVSTWENYWCVSDGQRAVILKCWRHFQFSAEFYPVTPDQHRKKDVVFPPYTGASCSMVSVGWLAMPIPELVGLLERYMGMIADPLAWVDKEVVNPLDGRRHVQEIVLKEDG